MVDAVELELFTNRFRALVGEMGERLRRTAVSVNVKERFDFSCALLDSEGRLVVNAPHIPVHLGSLGLCVRSVGELLDWRPGDVILTNHPGFGGSHLPDVTVITPVFADPVTAEGGRLLGFVANRAHHAEIGGSRPGSMPPNARSLAEEGVVFEPQHLARAGVFQWDEIRGRLLAGPYPSRAVEENLADLAAAVAANHRGSEVLRGLATRFGAVTVGRFMEALASQARDRAAAALSRYAPGVHAAEELLDDGTKLAVTIDLPEPGSDKLACFDFSGSAPVHPGNLNATPGIVRSVVLYFLRLLIDEPIPLNEGLLEEIELVIAPGILNPTFGNDPSLAPAVVGGNVETSQRLVDTLLKALGVAACSQGTMNNVLFGDETFAYYETVGGGCGAGPGFDGASGVHSHMTNTAITDPEVLENRYPVRLERFGYRRGSGGDGQSRGGEGLVRELTFLEDLSLSVLTQHRSQGPYGLLGGEAGKPGSQRVVRRSGGEIELGSVDACEVGVGDRFILETPGGGGFGSPEGGLNR
jgi:5-oxoprolinase (ATP-hydrolysing)